MSKSNFLANTEEDEVVTSGIGNVSVENSGQQSLESEGYWIDSALLGTTTENSANGIGALLNGGNLGLGTYEFTINVVVNSGDLQSSKRRFG